MAHGENRAAAGIFAGESGVPVLSAPESLDIVRVSRGLSGRLIMDGRHDAVQSELCLSLYEPILRAGPGAQRAAVQRARDLAQGGWADTDCGRHHRRQPGVRREEMYQV